MLEPLPAHQGTDGGGMVVVWWCSWIESSNTWNEKWNDGIKSGAHVGSFPSDLLACAC